MKFLLMFTLLFSVNSFASTMADDQCEEANVNIDVYVTRDRFEPRVIYLRESDRVCLNVHAQGYGASFSIEGSPMYASVPAGQTRKSFFRANRVGTFKINCRGGCALDVDAKVVVESRQNHDREEERQYKRDSESYRKDPRPPIKVDDGAYKDDGTETFHEWYVRTHKQ